MPKRIGLIGYGRWGKNWARVLNDLGVLSYILDADDRAATQAAEDYLDIPVFTGNRNLGSEYEYCDGVVIATPPHSHMDVASRFLYRGIPALVEKPLAITPSGARYLKKIAIQENVPLVVGHTFLYQNVVQGAKRVANNYLKDVYSISFNWLQNGTKGEWDLSCLWNLGPHPVSIASYLLNGTPKLEEPSVFKSENKDRITFQSYTEQDIRLSFNLSHEFPGKVREFTIRGRNGSVYCNARGDFFEILLNGAQRDHRWDLRGTEPLKKEAEFFLSSIESDNPPTGERAVWTVDLLHTVEPYG